MPVLQPEKTKPQKKPQARGFHPDAMAQAQALNQQPDSIPAMMKPGEYVLPPDTVAAVGGPDTLDSVVAQTHTQGNQEAIVPKGFQPRMFFADGGLSDEDEEKRRQAALQPSPSSPSSTYPGNRFPAYDGRSTQPQTPAKPLPPDAAQIASDREMVSRAASGFADGAGNLVRAAGDLAGLPVRAAAGVLDTVVVRPMRAGGLDVGYISPHLVPPGVDPSSMTPFSDAKKLANAAGKDAASVQPKGAGSLAPGATPQAQSLANAEEMQYRARQAEDSSATGTDLSARGLPGVYQHGRGQYSDNPAGMGFADGFTGQPSAQNMQAANALASQQQAQSTARVQAAQQQAVPQTRGFPGFEMPRQESAYEREARQRERNRIMGLLQTPMTGDPRRDLTASQRQQLVAQLGQESQERQATERNMFGLAGQHLNAETQRYSTDANAALGVERNSIDQQRVGLDGQRLGLAAQQQQEQSTARGFDIRQAQRKQSFQEAWAKGTKEQREQLQQMYPDLMPTDKEKPRFEVVRGRNNPVTGESGQDYVLRMNPNGTVEQVPVEGMGQGQPKPMPKNKGERVVGSLYVDNNGQLVRWTEKGAVAFQ